MDALEDRRQELSRDVVERVEGGDRLERRGRELEAREVRVHEPRLREVHAGTANLRGGDVYSRDAEALREQLRLCEP